MNRCGLIPRRCHAGNKRDIPCLVIATGIICDSNLCRTACKLQGPEVLEEDTQPVRLRVMNLARNNGQMTRTTMNRVLRQRHTHGSSPFTLAERLGF